MASITPSLRASTSTGLAKTFPKITALQRHTSWKVFFYDKST